MSKFAEMNLSRQEAEEIVAAKKYCADFVDLADALSDYGCRWDGDAADLYANAYWTIHKKYTFGVCEGRHQMPVNEYVFGNTVDPSKPIELVNQAWAKIPADAEHIDLYITGLTPATLAVVRVCARRGITLTAYNYDLNTGKYLPMPVLE